jgi:hypothetical protein
LLLDLVPNFKTFHRSWLQKASSLFAAALVGIGLAYVPRAIDAFGVAATSSPHLFGDWLFHAWR